MTHYQSRATDPVSHEPVPSEGGGHGWRGRIGVVATRPIAPPLDPVVVAAAAATASSTAPSTTAHTGVAGALLWPVPWGAAPGAKSSKDIVIYLTIYTITIIIII